jgi:hypothetical protein
MDTASPEELVRSALLPAFAALSIMRGDISPPPDVNARADRAAHAAIEAYYEIAGYEPSAEAQPL